MKNLFTILAVLFFCSTGIAQTFELASEINSNGNSNPFGFIEYNGRMYFDAEQSVNYNYFYTSDGTVFGTYQVPYLNSNTIPYYPTNITKHNGKLFFRAYDYSGDNELWISDGTASGTQPLKNINQTSDSYPGNFFSFGSILLFSADDGINGFELWKTDGTSSGTQLVKNINPTSGSNPHDFVELNGVVYFSANDSIHGVELWKTDGTSGGTQLVKDIYPQLGNSYPYELTLYNGKIYFTAADNSDTTGYANTELWVTDGTQSGTTQVKDIWADSIKGSNPGYLAEYNGLLYFKAYNGSSRGLWKSDGTTLGTQLVKDLATSSDYDVPLINYNGKLFFSVNIDTATEQGQLWQTDGTTSGTYKVKSFVGTPPQIYTVYNGKLYFTADQGSLGTDKRLWESDGTEVGSHIVEPAIAPNNNPMGSTYEFFQMGGSLFFAAGFDNSGIEVWKLTTTTGINETTLTRNLNVNVFPNPTSSSISLDISESIETVSFTLYNSLGQFIYQTTVNSSDRKINLGQQAAGLYNFTVKNKDSISTGKLIIQ